MCEHEEQRHHQGECGCEGHAHDRGHHCGGEHEERHHRECGCGCGHGEHHRHHDEGCGCGCRAVPWEQERPSWRRFATREERLARLERYLKDLRAEAQAVEEQISELKAGQQ